MDSPLDFQHQLNTTFASSAVTDSQLWKTSSHLGLKLLALARKFSQVNCPVLLRGATGSGKLPMAKTIHNFSAYRGEVFVDVNCHSLAVENRIEVLKQKSLQAGSGSLFVRHIEVLEPACLSEISRFWFDDKEGAQCRIFASISDLHTDNVTHTSHVPWLAMDLPHLSERQGDSYLLLQDLLRRYFHINALELSEECQNVLCCHNWRDNGKGLERAVATLSLMSGSHLIEQRQLLRLLPELEATAKQLEKLTNYRKRAMENSSVG